MIRRAEFRVLAIAVLWHVFMLIAVSVTFDRGNGFAGWLLLVVMALGDLIGYLIYLIHDVLSEIYRDDAEAIREVRSKAFYEGALAVVNAQAGGRPFVVDPYAKENCDLRGVDYEGRGED